MQQPPTYVNASYLDYVCRLHKSLCGLKQARRARFKRFTSHLLYLGFTASIVDRSLFVIHTPHVLLYLLLYVNDIIIKSPNPHHIAPLVTVLGHAFELKDLGPLNYFLGIQITPTSTGIALNQSKYALDLLHKFDMDNVKPIKTPCYPSIRLIPIFGHLLSDPSSYHNMVGGLQYLAFTSLTCPMLSTIFVNSRNSPLINILLLPKWSYNMLGVLLLPLFSSIQDN